MAIGRVPTEVEAARGIIPARQLKLHLFEQQVRDAVLHKNDDKQTRTNFVFSAMMQECARVGIPVREEMQMLGSIEFEQIAKSIELGQRALKVVDKGEIL